MISRYRDVAGGLMLIVYGLAFAGYAWANYPLGTLARMEPGLFPVSIGLIIAGLGAAVLAGGAIRRGVAGTIADFDPRTAAAVLAGVAAFAALVRPFGLVPAVCALATISALADNRLGPAGLAGLAAGLSTLVVVIFRFGLGLAVPIARWPF